jgi:hypothetical protein
MFRKQNLLSSVDKILQRSYLGLLGLGNKFS